MVVQMSPQRHIPALALLLLSGLSQSTGFRAHRSDSKTSAEKDDGAFVPLSRPTRVAVSSAKQSYAVAPQVGTFAAGSKFTSFRQALASVRMSANENDSAEGADMQSLATAAMDSGGNPAKIADEVENMNENNKEQLEAIKKDVKAMAKEMPGVSGPLGFFDPLGFCTDCSEGKLCFYREVELKHGRVAMLASLGFIVAEQFHPLFGGNIDLPSYIAFQETPLQAFWPAVVAAIAIPELFSVFTFKEPWVNEEMADGSVRTLNSNLWEVKTGGWLDTEFDPLGLKPTDPEELKQLQTKELNNGRLAMLAAAGMVAQELVTNDKLFFGNR
jgi:hypothetical protein